MCGWVLVEATPLAQIIGVTWFGLGLLAMLAQRSRMRTRGRDAAFFRLGLTKGRRTLSSGAAGESPPRAHGWWTLGRARCYSYAPFPSTPITMSRLPAVAIAIVLALPLPAQPHPSFAGEWTRVDSVPEQSTVARTGDARFRVGDMGSRVGFAALRSARHRDSLIVEFQHFAAYDLQPKLHYVFALDGSETQNRVTIGHAEAELRAQARWDGASLVIATSYSNPPGVAGGTTKVLQRLTLDANGRIEMQTVRPDIHGPNVVRTLFERR